MLVFRLRSEYRVDVILDVLPYESSSWLIGDVNVFNPPSDAMVVKDHRNRPVVLFVPPGPKTLPENGIPTIPFGNGIIVF